MAVDVRDLDGKEIDLAQARLDDGRKGVGDGHVPAQPHRLRLADPLRPAFEQPDAALRLARHPHPQRHVLGDLQGKGEQRLRPPLLQLELDLANLFAPLSAHHFALVEDELDGSAPAAEDPGRPLDDGFRGDAEPLAGVPLGQQLADGSGPERGEVELGPGDPLLPFGPAGKAAGIAAAVFHRLDVGSAFAAEAERIARSPQLAFRGVEIGRPLLHRPALRIAERGDVAKGGDAIGGKLELELHLLLLDHRRCAMRAAPLPNAARPALLEGSNVTI